MYVNIKNKQDSSLRNWVIDQILGVYLPSDLLIIWKNQDFFLSSFFKNLIFKKIISY